MKYEFEVLAALVQFKHVNTKVIVNSTGISERKVQSVLKDLHSNLGICINKRREKNSFYFFVESWGAFETGSAIIERLHKLDLAEAKARRISSKNQRKRKLLSLSDKIEYSNSVKLKNYNESLRLEGISSKKPDLSGNKKQLQDKRDELLKYYAKRAQLVNA
ncbi:YhfG family protein [Oceanospirillum maris]|uniref:YhfG family protein n=1 Tax=Oceanospirillum maris TaxID=64977 RepID=UPI00048A26D1|nr:YhfG family protein [Oceanospirillum maris]